MDTSADHEDGALAEGEKEAKEEEEEEVPEEETPTAVVAPSANEFDVNSEGSLESAPEEEEAS